MTVIVDTGALVALIDPDTKGHAWAREETARLPVPFLTSEAVLVPTSLATKGLGTRSDVPDPHARLRSARFRGFGVFGLAEGGGEDFRGFG